MQIQLRCPYCNNIVDEKVNIEIANAVLKKFYEGIARCGNYKCYSKFAYHIEFYTKTSTAKLEWRADNG